jgi:putative ABC transport system substrate-binding protein
MISRRQLLFALGAGSLAAPFNSFAQLPGKVWRIGFLSQRHLEFTDSDYYYGPFMQGMRELGYVEGKNLVMEWRSAEGNSERLPGLATELVQLNVDVLATSGTPASRAAQKATTTIPILMITIGNPVGDGLVQSLARPGGNSTGLANLTTDLGPKLLEMLRSMVPKLNRVAVLVNPANSSGAALLKNVQAAAQKFGVKVVPVEANSPQEIENAFTMMVRQKAEAVIVPQEALFQQQKSQIVELAAKHRLPSIGAYGEYVQAGGLMSYGQNIRENFHRAATYVDKILKGAKPGEIPMEQPTKFELFINGKTAKNLGLKIPQSLLISADKVIE